MNADRAAGGRALLPALPLFALHAVLFPGGWLALKVFEARYVDLIGRCLREGTPFGVVRLTEGSDVQRPGAAPVRFEAIGTLAQVSSVDADQPGILAVRCKGGERFSLADARQLGDGLWCADATVLAADAPQAIAPAQQRSARALRAAVASLAARDTPAVPEPHRFDDAGWVANRWCELLPIPLAARQRLMALGDPATRLALVDEFLHSRGIV